MLNDIVPEYLSTWQRRDRFLAERGAERLLATLSLNCLSLSAATSPYILVLSMHTRQRLWHLRRLRHDPDFDETWFDDHFCYGHNPNDVQPFHDLFGDSHRDIITEDSTNDALGNSTGTVEEVQAPKKYHTNIELYNLLQPDGMAIPYMYDNFLWSHCEVSLLIKACL